MPSGRVSVESSRANAPASAAVSLPRSPDERELIGRDQNEEAKKRRFHAARRPRGKRATDREHCTGHERNRWRPGHQPASDEIRETERRQPGGDREPLHEPDARQADCHGPGAREHPEEIGVALDRWCARVPNEPVPAGKILRKPQSDECVLGDAVEIHDVREEHERDRDHPPDGRIQG